TATPLAPLYDIPRTGARRSRGLRKRPGRAGEPLSPPVPRSHRVPGPRSLSAPAAPEEPRTAIAVVVVAAVVTRIAVAVGRSRVVRHGVPGRVRAGGIEAGTRRGVSRAVTGHAR